jgi:peptidoglycan hydrolase CwlO-like protein
LRDCNSKIDEAEAYARAEGKRIDLERARYQELLKELRRNERRVKELLSQVDEEQAKILSLTDSLGKTNDRMRIYKSQIESTESSAAQGNSIK